MVTKLNDNILEKHGKKSSNVHNLTFESIVYIVEISISPHDINKWTYRKSVNGKLNSKYGK